MPGRNPGIIIPPAWYRAGLILPTLRPNPKSVKEIALGKARDTSLLQSGTDTFSLVLTNHLVG